MDAMNAKFEDVMRLIDYRMELVKNPARDADQNELLRDIQAVFRRMFSDDPPAVYLRPDQDQRARRLDGAVHARIVVLSLKGQGTTAIMSALRHEFGERSPRAQSTVDYHKKKALKQFIKTLHATKRNCPIMGGEVTAAVCADLRNDDQRCKGCQDENCA